jgi:hypothetical protein
MVDLITVWNTVTGFWNMLLSGRMFANENRCALLVQMQYLFLLVPWFPEAPFPWSFQISKWLIMTLSGQVSSPLIPVLMLYLERK